MAIPPSCGRVVFDCQDLAAFTLEERVTLGLELVPERHKLFGTMAVEDNLAQGGDRAMKQRVPQRRRRIDKIYELSRGRRNGARNSPARCPAACARCWPWAAR